MSFDGGKKPWFDTESDSSEDYEDDKGDSNSLLVSDEESGDDKEGDGEVRERSVMQTNQQGKYNDVRRNSFNLGDINELSIVAGNREANCLIKEGSFSKLKFKSRLYDTHSLDSTSRVGCTFDFLKARMMGEEEDKDKGLGLGSVKVEDDEEEVKKAEWALSCEGTNGFFDKGPIIKENNISKGPTVFNEMKHIVMCDKAERWSDISDELEGPIRIFNEVRKGEKTKDTSISCVNNKVEKINEELSFDTECKNLRNSKKVRKKIREVLNLGGRAKNFVYPAEPLIHCNSDNLPGVVFYPHKSNYLSHGLPLTCDSLNHSDFINCNNRVGKRVFGKASEGLWNSMNNLGIVNVSKEYDLIQKLEEMEKMDSKYRKERKGNEIMYP